MTVTHIPAKYRMNLLETVYYTAVCVALAAFFDPDFPQYQIPPMPDSTIFKTLF